MQTLWQWCTYVDRVALHGRHGHGCCSMWHSSARTHSHLACSLACSSQHTAVAVVRCRHTVVALAIGGHAAREVELHWCNTFSQLKTLFQQLLSYYYFFQLTASPYNSQLVRSSTSASSTCSPAWPPAKHACTCWHDQPVNMHHRMLNTCTAQLLTVHMYSTCMYCRQTD